MMEKSGHTAKRSFMVQAPKVTWLSCPMDRYYASTSNGSRHGFGISERLGLMN
jgi:hypothetical protein